MTETPDRQKLLLQRIKQLIPTSASLNSEIAEILGISERSAYRRTGGEVEFTLSEYYKLSLHYKIDATLPEDQSGAIPFGLNILEEKSSPLDKFLSGLHNRLKMVVQMPTKEILYDCKDLPFLQLFHSRDVAAFKMFIWRKTYARFPEFKDRKFSLSDKEPELELLGNGILNTYMQIPSTEIWNSETVTSVLKQIEYYATSDGFSDINDAIILCDRVEELLYHIRTQAELGYKFPMGTKPEGTGEGYSFFLNELMLADNNILVRAGDNWVTYMVVNGVQFLETANPFFCKQTRDCMEALKQRSLQLSNASSRERENLFRSMTDKVEALRKRLRN